MMRWARRMFDTFTGKDVSDARQNLTDSSQWTRDEMEALVKQCKAHREAAEESLRRFEDIAAVLHSQKPPNGRD